MKYMCEKCGKGRTDGYWCERCHRRKRQADTLRAAWPLIVLSVVGFGGLALVTPQVSDSILIAVVVGVLIGALAWRRG